MAVLPPAPAPGYIFYPTDEDILNSFLKKKLQHLPLPSNMIQEADVYGTHPSNLTAQFAMTNKFFQWFFFTWTTQKHPDAKNSTRASRVAGPGRWKSTQSVRLVRNDFGRVIGSKQKFCYMEHTTQGKEEKTIWLMEEYSIKSLRTGGGVDMPKDKKKLDDWVVCKIYLRPRTCEEPSGIKVTAMKIRNLERPEIRNQPSTTSKQDSLISQIANNTLPHLIDASDREMVSFQAPCILLDDDIPQYLAPQYMDSFGSLHPEHLAGAHNEDLDYALQHETAGLPEIPHPLYHEQVADAPNEVLHCATQHDMGSLHKILHPCYHEQLDDAPNEGLHYAPQHDTGEQLAGEPDEGLRYAPQHDMGSLHEVLHPFYCKHPADAPNKSLHYSPQHDTGILHPFCHEQLASAYDEGHDCEPTSMKQLDLGSLPEVLPPLDLSELSIGEMLKILDDLPDEAPSGH